MTKQFESMKINLTEKQDVIKKAQQTLCFIVVHNCFLKNIIKSMC